MKTLLKISLFIVACAALINCKPDTKALEQAKLEGIKIGYDSAMKSLIIADSAQGFQKFLDDHPGNPGHVHDGPTITSTTANLESGVMAVTRSAAPGHARTDIELYVPFINPNRVAMTYANDGMSRTNHRHFKYDIIKIPVVDPTTGVSTGSQEVAVIRGHN